MNAGLGNMRCNFVYIEITLKESYEKIEILFSGYFILLRIVTGNI